MRTRYSIAAGILALGSWFTVFGLGLFIASKSYRDRLLHGFEWKAFVGCLFTYTPTNIAALCLFAAFAGGCASRLVIITATDSLAGGITAKPGETPEATLYMSEHPVSSMLRGFVVYIAFLAGVYITSNAPFADPTAEQYARAAGTISLLAFVVGYDPSLFRHLISLGSKLKHT